MYETRQELAEKIQWEGGIDEFLMGYGVSLQEIPEADEELRDALQDLLDIRDSYEAERDEFLKLLPESDNY